MKTKRFYQNQGPDGWNVSVEAFIQGNIQPGVLIIETNHREIQNLIKKRFGWKGSPVVVGQPRSDKSALRRYHFQHPHPFYTLFTELSESHGCRDMSLPDLLKALLGQNGL